MISVQWYTFKHRSLYTRNTNLKTQINGDHCVSNCLAKQPDRLYIEKFLLKDLTTKKSYPTKINKITEKKHIGKYMGEWIGFSSLFTGTILKFRCIISIRFNITVISSPHHVTFRLGREFLFFLHLLHILRARYGIQSIYPYLPPVS